MSCITRLLEMKGDKEFLPIAYHSVIEGGGTYNDYEYLITFTDNGSRCGYVALNVNETLTYDQECNIHCHGGITFNESDHSAHSAKDLLETPCDDVWIGFDAAHYNDGRCELTTKKYFGNDARILHNISGIHRDYDYMENQCKHIIDQLIGIMKEHRNLKK